MWEVKYENFDFCVFFIRTRLDLHGAYRQMADKMGIKEKIQPQICGTKR
jgi:hypothetical protein